MFDKITKPTILIDKSKALKNIKMMTAKAEEKGLIFRPHFKTHQSVEVGKWFRENGVDKATVSSVEMAAYFVKNGWKDLTIAFPVNVREVREINKLAKKINLNLLIESREAAIFLDENLKSEVGIFIKIDVGYNRAGIGSDNFHYIADLILFLQQTKKLKFQGLLTHAGHTYQCRGFEEIKEVHYSQMKKMKDLKKSLGHQYDNILLSIGDTPSCSLMDDFFGIDELRPGNFVFYDIMQKEIGSCEYEDIAIAVALPVVAKHKERNEIVVYGGGVHLSKESCETQFGKTFGLPVELTENGWSEPIKDSYVKSLSQEHGIIKLNKKMLEKINIGDLIGVLPVHSCLTVNLLKELMIL